jgi:hypothetical protein
MPAPRLGEIEGPPEPLAAPVPEPLPAPPQIQPQPQPRIATTRPQPAPTPRPQPPAAKATPAPAQQKTAATRPTGRLSGLLNGIGDRDSPSKRITPPAAVMSGQAAASIGALIRRQVQPCADRLVNPGPGASRIKVRINLKLNRDGSLKTRPAVEGVSGLDDENRRYAQRVKEMAVAAFTSCSPLRGLPPELYAVPNGWSDFDLNYNLP